ncbi:MAG: hypothetical protein JOZ41_12955 [Chloroflexi bacterium]|nr:hypothetical protein [Chloroflexota bacterium]
MRRMKRFAPAIVAGLLSLGLLGVTPGHSAAAGAAGSLDPTFGTWGRVLTNLGQEALPSDAVVQSNGDIVVSLGTPLGVVRYLPNGSLDSTFGHGGVALAGLNSVEDVGGLALQPDGKIVVAGSTQMPVAGGENTDFAIARFNANGTLDTSFGTGGTVTTEFFNPPLAGAFEAADAVVVQPDGKILVGGSARQGQIRLAPTETAIARYNPNGSLDASFGSGGEVLANGIGNVVTLGLDAAGDVFALDHGAIAELISTGRFDSSVMPAPITISSHGGVDAFQANGQYVSANTVFVVRGDTDVQVQRFTPAGSPDPTFTSPNIDYTAQEARDGASAVAIQPNGQIVVAGAHFFGTSVFGVGRVNATGSLDAGFGSGGALTTTFFGNDTATALVIQADGKIVAIGSATNNTTGVTDLALARYLG